MEKAATKRDVVCVSATTLIGIILITQKLTGVIDWPWIWVTLPFWGMPCFIIVLISLIAILGSIGVATTKLSANESDRNEN